MDKPKRSRIRIKAVWVFFAIFIPVNEVYRYIEVQRLTEFDCVYAGYMKPVTASGETVSIIAKDALDEFQNVYTCSDGVQRTSIYRNDRFVRPWEK